MSPSPYCSRYARTRVSKPVDGTLVFGVPLVAFGLQTVLVQKMEYGAAYSALALSFFYLLLAKILFARITRNVRLLVESFLALGVVFGTLAVPLALDGRWTAATWALEGATIVWVGVRQDKILARGFGIFLQFAAGAAFFLDAQGSRGVWPVLNSVYLGGIFISVGGLFCSWFLQRRRAGLKEIENSLRYCCFVGECCGGLAAASMKSTTMCLAILSTSRSSIIHGGILHGVQRSSILGSAGAKRNMRPSRFCR